MSRLLNKLFLYLINPLMQRPLEKWYAWQFNYLPYREHFASNEEPFDSIVILPTKYIHDAGFRCMDFVGIRNFKPVCRLSGCSDIIHFDGIGGFGYRWINKGGVPTTTPVKDWNIDCLPTSGLLRIFSHQHKILAGSSLGSFEIFAVENAPTKKNHESLGSGSCGPWAQV
jgi:hypothetical protein